MSKETDKDVNGTTAMFEIDEVDEKTEMLVEPEIENKAEKYLIYGINDSPPIYVTIICALQVNKDNNFVHYL
jgi:hypothetical protein